MSSPFCAVTGATEGIGRAFAQRLAHDGWRVLAMGRSSARLTELLNEMPGEGHSYLATDLAETTGLDMAVQRLRKIRPSLLVNNAGITHYGTFSDVDLSAQERVLNLNCKALATLAHQFLADAVRGDALLNVSSMLAFMPQPTSALYAASKAFVTSLSQTLWYEYKRRGVYVVGLHPGITTGTEFRRRGGGTPSRAPWAMTADQVAAIGVRALARRRGHTIVCGRTNQVMAWASRIAPRSALMHLLGRARDRNQILDSTQRAP